MAETPPILYLPSGGKYEARFAGKRIKMLLTGLHYGRVYRHLKQSHPLCR